jgi:membrane associated rhomboid family serine protease
MIFLLPFRTNVRMRITPYTNYALIIVNIIIFLLTYSPHRLPFSQTVEVLRPWAEVFMLNPAHPHLWQFVTYAFLHGSILHIAGNMFFLYLFGNNINDKLGHFNYLCFYLAGAIFSGIGHTLLNNSPVLGASGAIAAVTGAFLVFFPQTLISIFFLFFWFIDWFDWPALYFIAFKMIFWDNVIARYGGYVAYDAHLAGYAFGILCSLILLATGLTSSSHFDLWSMLKQWNRRRQYRDVIATGYDPYTGLGGAKRINVREVAKPENPEITRLREAIANYIYQHNIHAATDLYLKLLNLDDSQVIPRQQLLDIANQLASDGRHQDAALVYENFLAHYSNYEYIEQVQLMLGLIYSRYLDKPDLALQHLALAEHKLTDPAQLLLCRSELDKLRKQ